MIQHISIETSKGKPCKPRIYAGNKQMYHAGEPNGITEKPACTCAAVIHHGPYEDLKYAYDALCAWMVQHPEYQVCGPAIERYIKDETSVSSPEEYETGVLFLVR